MKFMWYVHERRVTSYKSDLWHETDTLSLVFHEDGVSESDELRGNIIVDYDEQGKVISIEIIDVSKILPKSLEVTYGLQFAGQ